MLISSFLCFFGVLEPLCAQIQTLVGSNVDMNRILTTITGARIKMILFLWKGNVQQIQIDTWLNRKLRSTLHTYTFVSGFQSFSLFTSFAWTTVKHVHLRRPNRFRSIRLIVTFFFGQMPNDYKWFLTGYLLHFRFKAKHWAMYWPALQCVNVRIVLDNRALCELLPLAQLMIK